MVEQNNTTAAGPERRRLGATRGRRGMFLVALLAVALVAGVDRKPAVRPRSAKASAGITAAGATAACFGGPLTPAQIDDRIDRMTKHMAIEIDATADQQDKIAGIAKAAVKDLLPMREKAQAARSQAVALLTAPTIDRSCNRAAARRADRARGNGEQAHRAGAGRRRRSAQPRAAQEDRGLDDVEVRGRAGIAVDDDDASDGQRGRTRPPDRRRFPSCRAWSASISARRAFASFMPRPARAASRCTSASRSMWSSST